MCKPKTINLYYLFDMVVYCIYTNNLKSIYASTDEHANLFVNYIVNIYHQHIWLRVRIQLKIKISNANNQRYASSGRISENKPVPSCQHFYNNKK